MGSPSLNAPRQNVQHGNIMIAALERKRLKVPEGWIDTRQFVRAIARSLRPDRRKWSGPALVSQNAIKPAWNPMECNWPFNLRNINCSFSCVKPS